MNSVETDYKAAPENVLQQLYDLINIKKNLTFNSDSCIY